MQRIDQSGFTLIESMVTVAIIAVLVTMAIPDYFQQTANQRLKDDITNLRGELQVARAAAMTTGSPVVLALNQPAANQYQLFLDNGAVGGVFGDGIWNGCEPLIGPGGRLINPIPPCGVVPDDGIRTLNPWVTVAILPPNAVIGFASSGRRNKPAIGQAGITLQNGYNLQRALSITVIGEVTNG